MGACDFQEIGVGSDARSIFNELCTADRLENGRSYSGGIGMKESFVAIDVPYACQTDEQCSAFADALLDADDKRCTDKWGPAGAIRLRDTKDGRQRWLFFGFAAS